MPKKTNKTSHVLSLLTNGADPEEISGQDLSEKETLKSRKRRGRKQPPWNPCKRYLPREIRW